MLIPFARATAPPRGSGAPRLTHASKSAMTAAGSLPSFGIFTSPSWRRALISRLSLALPGTIAGPVSPPLSSPSRVSSSSPPRSFFFARASALWQA